MKHEAILAGHELLPRDPRVDTALPVRVLTDIGEVAAHIVNLSSDGFRLRTDEPLETGWVVTLEAARQFPVKALICWACEGEAGGIFSEPVAL